MFDPNDNEMQFSANEIFMQLEETDIAHINNELFDLAMIEDKFDQQDLLEAVRGGKNGDSSAIRKLYINTISEMMQ